MVENETTRRTGNATQGVSGFVVRPAPERQAHSRAPQERNVGGFSVIDASEHDTDTRIEGGSASVSVEQPLPRSRRCSLCGQTGHTARNCSSDNVARTAPRAPSGQAISITAPLLVGTFNLFIIESMGENCGITEKEAQFLIPSTQRTLERLPKGAAERLAVVIDPAIIIAVFGMWFKRIADIKRAEALQKFVVNPHEQARANGVSGTEYRVEHPRHDDPGVDNGMTYQVPMGVEQGWPMPPEVPMPDHPDATANGVPPVIRESFSAGGDTFNSTL